MIERLLRNTHHVIKRVPFLRRLDAWAVEIWFRQPFIRRAFEISLLLKLTALAIRKRRRLVVLCRFGGIGDMICGFPAVREFIRQNGENQVVYVTRIAYRGLVERADLQIPCVTSAMHVLPPEWATWIVKKCVYLTYLEENAHVHQAPLSLIEGFEKSLGFDPLSEEPVLEVDASRVEGIRASYLQGAKKQIVLFHAGPTWPVKAWPIESWSRLAARLNENPSLQLLQLVADRNVTVKNARTSIIPGAVPVECADNMERLIDTVAAADLLVGIDSGPIHVAAAVGTNCLAIFGPTNPSLLRWKRGRSEAIVHKLDCSFCHHRRPRLHWLTGCPYDIACMQGVTVEQVFDQASHFLPLPPSCQDAS